MGGPEASRIKVLLDHGKWEEAEAAIERLERHLGIMTRLYRAAVDLLKQQERDRRSNAYESWGEDC